MPITGYLIAALIALCLGEAALLRHWVKFRRRECAKCIDDMHRKFNRANQERRPTEQSREKAPTIMTPPISTKIQ